MEKGPEKPPVTPEKTPETVRVPALKGLEDLKQEAFNLGVSTREHPDKDEAHRDHSWLVDKYRIVGGDYRCRAYHDGGDADFDLQIKILCCPG